MLMIKCKTYGKVFGGLYDAEDSNQEFRISTNANTSLILHIHVQEDIIMNMS